MNNHFFPVKIPFLFLFSIAWFAFIFSSCDNPEASSGDEPVSIVVLDSYMCSSKDGSDPKSVFLQSDEQAVFFIRFQVKGLDDVTVCHVDFKVDITNSEGMTTAMGWTYPEANAHSNKTCFTVKINGTVNATFLGAWEIKLSGKKSSESKYKYLATGNFSITSGNQ